MSQDPSPRRFAIWTISLLLPLVLAAAALPWIRRSIAPKGGQPVAGAAAAVRAAETVTAERVRRADEATGAGGAAAEAPRPPEAPTTEQIEAAREAQEALIKAQRGWKKVETIAPRSAQRDASGELVAPFQGFGLSVESTPPGAVVQVGGKEAGETPLVTTVDCRPGEPVEVRVERRGLRPQVRSVRCRADALVTVQVKLAR